MIRMIADMKMDMAGHIQPFPEDGIKDMLGQGTGSGGKWGLR